MGKTQMIGVGKQHPMIWRKQGVLFGNSIETGQPKESLNERLAMVQYSRLSRQSAHLALV
jgi:hypothetical protein